MLLKKKAPNGKELERDSLGKNDSSAIRDSSFIFRSRAHIDLIPLVMSLITFNHYNIISMSCLNVSINLIGVFSYLKAYN